MFDVWGHAYRHREDGHWLVVYQDEHPMDWEWEDAQTTIWQLWQQLNNAQSLTKDLYEELAHARAQIWELERSARYPSLTPVTSCGWGLS